MNEKRGKKHIPSKGISPKRRYGRVMSNRPKPSYTTRHGHEFKATKSDDAQLACDALRGLEAEKIDPPHALAWLVERSLATDDQPDTHDENLIQLVDGRDIQWNADEGQWEPGIWFHSGS